MESINPLRDAVWASRIESAENRVRQIHNELESQKVLGRKNYLPYENIKLITMINMTQELLKG